MINQRKKSSDYNLIKEELGIKLMDAKHPLIKKLKKEYPTSIHGNKFWSSSYLIMDYLNDNRPKKKTKILEIGCGWDWIHTWTWNRVLAVLYDSFILFWSFKFESFLS